MEPTRIIFLDIDGVLNDWERSWREVPDYNPEFVPKCVKAFNRIIRETEAKIVLSSSWRYYVHGGSMTLTGFAKLLRSHSVRGELIGLTRRDESGEDRWQQIADWLKSPEYHHDLLRSVDRVAAAVLGETIREGKVRVHRYCIIDDDPDAFGGRPGVQTAGGRGLTEADADEAIRILTE